MPAILQLISKTGWTMNMKGSAVAGRVNKTQYRNCFLALALPLLLAGCGLKEGLAEAEASWSEPFRWIIKYWTLSLIWILPALMFLSSAHDGYWATSRRGSGSDQYGNTYTYDIPLPEPVHVGSNREAVTALTVTWLVLFPVGYALYPWYAPIWQTADNAGFTPYPNLDWHLIKWVFPLVVLILAWKLIGYGLSRTRSNRIARNLFKAGKVMMWLGVAWVVTPPAYLVLSHLFERPESEMVAAPAEPPPRLLPTQPKNLKIPENGEFDPYATQLWTCKRGFSQVGNACEKR